MNKYLMNIAWLASCKIEPEPQPAVPGPAPVSAASGLLQLRNALTADSNATTIVPNAIVIAQRPQDVDGINIVSSAVSDSLGRFRITGLLPDSPYVITCHAVYAASLSVSIPIMGVQSINGRDSNFQFVLRVNKSQQYGLLVNAIDMDSNRLFKAKVLIYGSRVLAEADTGYSGANAIFETATDVHGQLLALKLPPGQVFLKGRLQLDNTIYLSSAVILTTIVPDDIQQIHLFLK